MATATRLLSLSLLLAAACGEVVQLEAPTPQPTGGARAETGDLDAGIEPTSPVVEHPLVIDAPRAATTAAALFQMTVRDHARVLALIGTASEPQVDVLEQRIITKHDAPVELAIDVAPPAGTFTRVIASDAISAQFATVARVLCEQGPIATFDPRCERAAPTPTARTADGAITASRWRLWVMDEATGAAVPGCTALGTHLSCALPGRAAATYRIVASVDGVSQLWGASTAPSVLALAGKTFTGATGPEFVCVDWEATGTALYCTLHWAYTRFTAVDRLGLELDPLSVTITAGGVASSHESPALAWDSGDADLPGPVY